VHDACFTVALIYQIEHLVYFLLTPAVQMVSCVMIERLCLLQAANAHAQQADRRGPMALAPFFEKSSRHLGQT
jgi:hypothetical protein